MQQKKVTMVGGSGFVGSAIAHQLSNAGYEVKVLTRRREAHKHLILLPHVQLVECDVMNDTDLVLQLRGSDVVISLAGILHESKHANFAQIHTELPRRIAQICAKQGVERLIHVSALHASASAPSEYLRSKAAGEAAIMTFEKQVHTTIFRPSVIFGRADNFINMFASLIKIAPVIPVAKPDAKFQPVWVEDVAKAVVKSIHHTETYGKTYDLGGPRVYSMRELIQFVAFILGKKRTVIGLNDQLSYAQAMALEFSPVKLMTRDNLRSMQVDSVTQQPFPVWAGVSPASMEAIVPEYLANQSPRNAYMAFRSLAGR